MYVCINIADLHLKLKLALQKVTWRLYQLHIQLKKESNNRMTGYKLIRRDHFLMPLLLGKRLGNKSISMQVNDKAVISRTLPERLQNLSQIIQHGFDEALQWIRITGGD